MFQIQFVKGTVVGEPRVTDVGCVFYLNTVHNMANNEKQTQRFLVNYKNTGKASGIHEGDHITFMGVIKGDEDGRPFIRENDSGERFTVFDVETFRVYKENEDFAFSLTIGNVGRDADARYTQSGKLVSSFGLATNEYKMKANNQFEKATIWWRVSTWENLADRVSNEVKKGMKLLLFGVLNYDPQTGGPRIWERDVDGMKVPAASYEMTAYNYKKLDKSTNGYSDGPEPYHQEVEEDVIPF